MPIAKDETLIQGAWELVGGRMVADASVMRIQSLIGTELEKVADTSGGWETLYRDRSDGRLWERFFPFSEINANARRPVAWMLQIDSGIRLFCVSPRRSNWPLVYVVAIFALTYVSLTQPIYLRIILNSLLLIPIYVDAALPLLRTTAPKGHGFGYHFTAAVLIMGPVAACVRIVAVYSLRARHDLYFSASRLNTLFFCMVMLLLLALAFGFISLTHERVLAELEETHEQLMTETRELARVEGKLARSERLAAVGRLAGGVAHFSITRCILSSSPVRSYANPC